MKTVAILGSKGGTTKTASSHLLCLGAYLQGIPAAYRGVPPFLGGDAGRPERRRLTADSIGIAGHLRVLWHAGEMTFGSQSDRALLGGAYVVVQVEPQSEYVDATIYWYGGFTSQHQVVRPVFYHTQLRDYDLLIARITTLHREGKTVPAIAKHLNREGFVPPRRRGASRRAPWPPFWHDWG